MKRLLNFLGFFRLAPEVKDVTERLYPESDRRHRAQPTSTYEPDLNPAAVVPLNRWKK